MCSQEQEETQTTRVSKTETHRTITAHAASPYPTQQNRTKLSETLKGANSECVCVQQ